MDGLLDVLARSGVPKAGTDYRWPLDVVTQILRDHAGSPLPIRGGLSAADAARMKRRFEGAETGGWLYETTTHQSHRGTYTVVAVATRARPRKLASRKRTQFNLVPVGEDELDFPGTPEVQDTRGRTA